MPAYADEAFVDGLSRANAGRGGWDGGWSVIGIEPDVVLLERDGLQVRACPHDCGPAARAPRLGDLVGVRRDNEHRHLAPGFYTAIGEAADAAPPDALEVRVYFDESAAGAAGLVEVVGDGLNVEGVPFVLKIPRSPAGLRALRRRGALPARGRPAQRRVAVCRRARRRRAGVREAADERHRRWRASATPGSSFGSSRCALAAEGIVDAHERRVRSLADRLEAVERAFAGAGLRLDLAHLARPGDDRYVL